MVLGSISKYLVYGLLAAFAITSLAQPSRAYAATQVFGGVGSSLSSLGTGIKDLFEGTGTGVSKLFNPLFTLRDLIYGPQAGQQAALDVREETSTGNIATSSQAIEATAVLQDNPAALVDPAYQSQKDPILNKFVFTSQPSISPAPVASSVVHGQTMPLSQAAINHYQSLGVSVSPSNSQTVASRNTSNASSPSSQASNASRSASAPSSASAASTRASSPSSSVSAKSAASVSSSVSRGTSRYSRR